MLWLAIEFCLRIDKRIPAFEPGTLNIKHVHADGSGKAIDVEAKEAMSRGTPTTLGPQTAFKTYSKTSEPVQITRPGNGNYFAAWKAWKRFCFDFTVAVGTESRLLHRAFKGSALAIYALVAGKTCKPAPTPCGSFSARDSATPAIDAPYASNHHIDLHLGQEDCKRLHRAEAGCRSRASREDLVRDPFRMLCAVAALKYAKFCAVDF